MTIAFTESNGYLDLPIDTVVGSTSGQYADNLIQNALAAIAKTLPGWKAAEGNIEVLLLEQFAAMVAETASVAAQVPLAIFSYMGTLVGITPLQGSYATAQTTWQMIDAQGYVIPAGTLVGYEVLGNDLYQFQTVTSVTVPKGSTSTAAGAVTIQAVNVGDQYDGLTAAAFPTLTLISSLAFVASVSPTTTTSGGTSVETTTEYLNRLSNELQLLAPRPILPQDFAALAQSVAGVYRAAAFSGVNPYANILSIIDATFGTGIGGWTALNANSTVASAVGSNSSNVLKVTAGNAGTATGAISAKYPVAQQQSYNALIEFDVASVARQAQITITCYDVNNSVIGLGTTSSIALLDSTTLYTTAWLNFTTPANTFKVSITVTFGTGGSYPANTETHQVARASLWNATAPLNLVPDAAMQHVTDAFTWYGVGNTYPPTNLSVVPFATGANGLQYTGTGSAGPGGNTATCQRTVLPAGTYTVSSYIDASHVTAGAPNITVTDDTNTVLATLAQSAGTAGVVTGSFTLASATVCQLHYLINGCTVQAGLTMTFAEPSIALTSLGALTWANGPSFSTAGATTNVERTVTVAAVDDNGLALAPSVQASLAAYLTALREVNFVVNVIGPSYTTIDVAWTGVASTNANKATVLAAANAALTAYLSPANWAGGTAVPPYWDPTQKTVYYLSIVGLLSETPGMDHLTSVKIGYGGQSVKDAQDYALLGNGPLPQAGNIQGSVF